MEISKMNYYKITSIIQKEPTKLLFNDNKHEARVKSVEIKFSHNNVGLVINNLTLSDLKDLRKIVRKQIKELQK
jgi:hypothetical protein